MSLLDKIRSYAEARSPAGEPLPDGAFNYGEMRDLWRLLNERKPANPPIVFTPGSKVIFVAGGYEGGRERVGVVLGVTSENHVLLCMLDDEQLNAPSPLESFAASWLEREIADGRREGSMKEVRYVPHVQHFNPHLRLADAPQVEGAGPRVVDGGYATEDPGDGGREGRRYGN